jgi:imidazoleglycerol-phosphate dehydratase
MNSRRRQAIERGAEGAPLHSRRAEVIRTTSETDISLKLDLDGHGVADVVTGIGFFDHMLTLFAHHGGFDLTVRAGGDLHVDGHHTVEDVGLALGQALREALGEKRGIRRYGSFLLPMDEALAMVALDLSGRPYFAHDLQLSGIRVGEFDADLTPHFFRSLATQSGMTLHIRLLAGSDAHHIVEAVFKGFGRALDQATRQDPRAVGVPSTKGTLSD